jgi:hypothetical protein
MSSENIGSNPHTPTVATHRADDTKTESLQQLAESHVSSHESLVQRLASPFNPFQCSKTDLIEMAVIMLDHAGCIVELDLNRDRVRTFIAAVADRYYPNPYHNWYVCMWVWVWVWVCACVCGCVWVCVRVYVPSSPH